MCFKHIAENIKCPLKDNSNWAKEKQMNSIARKKVIQKYYSKRAMDYDRQKSRTWKIPQGFADEVTSEMLGALKDFEDKLVLEVGSGTGRNALPLLEKVNPRFVGLDLSREMLKLAKTKMPRSKDRVHLVLGDAEHLPFADEVFDAVLCMSTMHYFESQAKVLALFSRVLRNTGIFVYGDLTVHELDDNGFFERLERTVSKAHVGYCKPSEAKRLMETSGLDVSKLKTVAYRKSFRSLMEDKGAYFGVKSETLQEFISNAASDAKKQYALTSTELTLYYTIITAQKTVS